MKHVVLGVFAVCLFGCRHDPKAASGGDDLGVGDLSDVVGDGGSDVSPRDAHDAARADLLAPDTVDLAGPVDLAGASASDGSTTTTPSSLDNLCIEDGWCWERPSHFGANLKSIWGSSWSDVWVVGEGGTLLHFDGSEWKRWPAITPERLESVHGSGPDDVWAVGQRVILHFDGDAWSLVSGAPQTKGWLHSVRAIAKNDVWFGGDYFARLHWNGSTWSLTEETTVQAIYAMIGFAPNDVWAVGEFISHWDGSTWTWSGGDFNGYPTCRDAWGTAADDIYLACSDYGGGLQHWNGTTWARVKFPTGVSPVPHIVAGSSTDDLWVLSSDWHSAHWDGMAWTRTTNVEDDSFLHAWFAPDGRGFLIGDGGRIVQRDTTTSTTFATVSGNRAGWLDDLSSVFALSDDDIWVAGRLRLLRLQGGAWQDVPAAVTTYRQEFTSIWASGPNDAWAVAWGDEDSTQHWDGTAWSVVHGGTPGGYLDSVFGFAANDVWLMTDDGDPLHWNGTMLTNADTTFTGYYGQSAVHGTASNDVWLLHGKARHWNGTTMTPVTLPDPVPKPAAGWETVAVHAIAPDDVWISGTDNYLARWNGTEWTMPPKPAIRGNGMGIWEISSFAGTSSNDLWAVASGGDIFHFDGTTWTRSASPGVGLSEITRTPSGQLLVVGGSGAILRRK